MQINTAGKWNQIINIAVAFGFAVNSIPIEIMTYWMFWSRTFSDVKKTNKFISFCKTYDTDFNSDFWLLTDFLREIEVFFCWLDKI